MNLQNQEIEALEKFSKRQKNGKLKYFVRYKCFCGKIKIGRQDCKRKSCGCLHIITTPRVLFKGRKPLGERVKNTLFKAQEAVYKFYSDGDIGFNDFLLLSQKECHYCGALLSNSMNMALRKDGKPRQSIRVAKDGSKHIRKVYTEDIGKAATFKYNGLDRLDCSRGHFLDNVVTCCKTCNLMKRKFTREEFITHIEGIYRWVNGT